MSEIIVFAGTTEGCDISNFLAEHQIHVLACVATDYGSKSLKENEYLKIHAGRLTEPEMEALLNEKKPEMVLDATHPYAAEVTENIRTACQNTVCCGRLEPIRTRPFMCRIPRLPLNFWRGQRAISFLQPEARSWENTPHFLMLESAFMPVSFPCPL